MCNKPRDVWFWNKVISWISLMIYFERWLFFAQYVFCYLHQNELSNVWFLIDCWNLLRPEKYSFSFDWQLKSCRTWKMSLPNVFSSSYHITWHPNSIKFNLPQERLKYNYNENIRFRFHLESIVIVWKIYNISLKLKNFDGKMKALIDNMTWLQIIKSVLK